MLPDALLYALNLAIFVPVGLARVVRLRRGIPSLVTLFYLAFGTLVIIPAYPVFASKFQQYQMTSFFASLSVVNLIALAFVVRSKTRDWPMAKNPQARASWASTLLVIVFMSAAVVYIGLYLRHFGTDYLIAVVRKESSPVSAREVFWREILPWVPFGSVLRFLAKWGSLLYGLCCIHAANKLAGTVLLLLSLAAHSVELTKSGTVLFLASLVLYGVWRLRRKQAALLALGIVLGGFVGVLLAGLEVGRRGDQHYALLYFLYRVFGAPAETAMVPYVVFPTGFNLGLTIPLFANLRGGYARLLGETYLDYDNYLGRVFYGSSGLYGSANSPFFTYAHTELGLLGVVLYTLALMLALKRIDGLIRRSPRFHCYYAVFAVFVVIVATSCDFVQWLTGVEYLFGLLTIYTVIETVNGSTAPVDLWIYLFFCMGFYVLSGLSYRFLP